MPDTSDNADKHGQIFDRDELRRAVEQGYAMLRFGHGPAQFGRVSGFEAEITDSREWIYAHDLPWWVRQTTFIVVSGESIPIGDVHRFSHSITVPILNKDGTPVRILGFPAKTNHTDYEFVTYTVETAGWWVAQGIPVDRVVRCTAKVTLS